MSLFRIKINKKNWFKVLVIATVGVDLINSRESVFKYMDFYFREMYMNEIDELNAYTKRCDTKK